MEPAEVVALAGAFGAGSLLTTLVQQGSDRRRARSEVLLTMNAVVVDLPRGQHELASRLYRVQAAALVARVPDMAIDQYTQAVILRWEALNRLDEAETTGELAAAEHLWSLATAAMAVALWHPWLGRPKVLWLNFRWRWLRRHSDVLRTTRSYLRDNWL